MAADRSMRDSNDAIRIPVEFAHRIRQLHGNAGREWIDALPGLLSDIAARWSLTISSPMAPLSYGYVAPAERADGSRAVVKATVPDAGPRAEAAALTRFDGRGAVRLLDADLSRGVLLLERVEPGSPLSHLEDDEAATSAAAALMRALHRPVPDGHSFATLADWQRGFARLRRRFDGGCGPLPTRLFDAAESGFSELLASAPAPVLLHGDLHHANILSATRRPWLAVDPKGVVGDPAFEVAPFLRNPAWSILESRNTAEKIARRLDRLSEILSADRSRLLAWTRAEVVLSACWQIEDHGAGIEPHLRYAEIVSQL